MVVFLTVANWLLPLVYLAILLEYGVCFFQRAKAHGRNLWLLPAIAFAVAAMVTRAIYVRRAYPGNIQETLSVVALATTVAYTIVEYHTRERRTGVFVFLLVFLFQYTASVLGEAAEATQALGAQPAWSRAHLHPAILACTALTLAAVYGGLHRLTQRNLKTGRVGILFDRLPPLERVGKMCEAAVVAGLIFLTVTIATGAMLHTESLHAGGMTFRLLSKIVTGSLAWLVYAAAVFGRFVLRWPAGRMSGVAVYGYAVVLLLIASMVLT